MIIKNKKYICVDSEIFTYPISLSARGFLLYLQGRKDISDNGSVDLCKELCISQGEADRINNELERFGLIIWSKGDDCTKCITFTTIEARDDFLKQNPITI